MNTVCNPGAAGRSGVISDAQRLEALKAARECVTYHDAPLAEDRDWTLRLFGNCRTGELFVQVANGASSAVRAFPTSATEMSPDERAEGIAWPDLVEAFALAREMHRAAVYGGPSS
ncbi:MAG: hypothetical protein KF897_04870 [Opitutaceae bacterium]|nr:hypothetical protein [Opitutaceae bacterium]